MFFVKLLISSIIIVFVAYFLNTDCFADYWLPPFPVINLNKTWTDKVADNDDVQQIHIKVHEDILTLLRYKLSNRTVSKSLPDSNFTYGFNSNYLEILLEYWLTKYNWQIWEDKINSFPHFFTTINGLQIHFIHIRPTLKPGQKLVPILLLHGWPGSFFEFYKLIPLLTNVPESESIVFEVVCPSLPGYGWSDASEKPGLGVVGISAIMFKLMDRLNVTEKFYIQGGDYGSIIASTMSKINPGKIAGMHINMPQLPMNDPRYWLKVYVGSLLPKGFHFLSEKDQALVYPVGEKIKNLLNQLGYFWLQATRPSTIGIALTDSPAGLAAYIIEKFGAWSNDLEEHLHSASGGIEGSRISVDEMLTNVMIYYITNSISSSVRLYKEIMAPEEHAWDSYPVTVPVALASFPKEIFHLPRPLASFKYRDIRQYTEMPRGGHFAALEEPVLLADDIKSFVTVVHE